MKCVLDVSIEKRARLCVDAHAAVTPACVSTPSLRSPTTVVNSPPPGGGRSIGHSTPTDDAGLCCSVKLQLMHQVRQTWLTGASATHREGSPRRKEKKRKDLGGGKKYELRSHSPCFSIFDAEDCVTPVLLHLQVQHVVLLSQVSRFLNRSCESNELWAAFCLRGFGEDSDKIMRVYEKAEVLGSPGSVQCGMGSRGLYRGIQYKALYRKMMNYEIELHFLSGPMGNPIIKVVSYFVLFLCPRRR